MLKNIVLFVHDIESSMGFYREIFGLAPKAQYEGNVVLVGGLVLQDISVWETQTGRPVAPGQGSTMLYFEEPSIEAIREKLQHRGIETILSEDKNPDGKHFIRFCDPEGHLIEVAQKG